MCPLIKFYLSFYIFLIYFIHNLKYRHIINVHSSILKTFCFLEVLTTSWNLPLSYLAIRANIIQWSPRQHKNANSSDAVIYFYSRSVHREKTCWLLKIPKIIRVSKFYYAVTKPTLYIRNRSLENGRFFVDFYLKIANIPFFFCIQLLLPRCEISFVDL